MKQDTKTGQRLDKFTDTVQDESLVDLHPSPPPLSPKAYTCTRISSPIHCCITYTLTKALTTQSYSETILVSSLLMISILGPISLDMILRYTLAESFVLLTVRSAGLGYGLLFLCPFLKSGTEHLSGVGRLDVSALHRRHTYATQELQGQQSGDFRCYLVTAQAIGPTH